MKTILMADIIGSSKRHDAALMNDFKTMVEVVNKKNKAIILSPLTITLGDEFQGVIKDADAAVKIVLEMEKMVMALKKPFKLRYVVLEGEIQTKLNKTNAHQMLGPGLTQARELLNSMKTSKNRFAILLKDAVLTERLNAMFFVLQGISDRWTESQQKIASAFLNNDDYKTVAVKLKKDPTSAWRRKKTLMIDEYNTMKELTLNSVHAK